MTISYLVLTCGEPQTLALLSHLKKCKAVEDKVVVLYDNTESRPEFERKLKASNIIKHALGKDYSAHRNFALDQIKTDYVFALDADECPMPKLTEAGGIKTILEDNHLPDIVCVPRLNLFAGVTPWDCLQYNWTLHHGIVQWPDFQTRIFKNRADIRFVGVLHERIKNLPHHRVSYLPQTQEMAILHKKDIVKQRADNARYADKWSEQDNLGMTTLELLQKQ